MKLPDLDALMSNLKETIVVQAESLYLLGGGDKGSKLVAELTGVVGVDDLPTDWFTTPEALEEIDLQPLAITQHIRELYATLASRSTGYGPGSDALDSDWIEQEHLDFIELYLAGLATIALGGLDWTGCITGAVKELFLCGRAWHHLLQTIDAVLCGSSDDEFLTPIDLSFIAGIEERSLRNSVGPTRSIRTIERKTDPGLRVAGRAFVAVNSLDAMAWLRSRKSFQIAPVRHSIVQKRLTDISDLQARSRAALMGAYLTGETQKTLMSALGVSEIAIRKLSDGEADHQLAENLVRLVMEKNMDGSSEPSSALSKG